MVQARPKLARFGLILRLLEEMNVYQRKRIEEYALYSRVVCASVRCLPGSGGGPPLVSKSSFGWEGSISRRDIEGSLARGGAEHEDSRIH